MKKYIFSFIVIFCLTIGTTQAQEKTKVSVALFAWIPEMALAFEQIESDFEKKHPNYDLEIEAIDPYSEQGFGIYNGIDDFYDFDVVEIDYYSFNDINRSNPPSLDAIPEKVTKRNDYVGSASKIPTKHFNLFVPHWNLWKSFGFSVIECSSQKSPKI